MGAIKTGRGLTTLVSYSDLVGSYKYIEQILTKIDLSSDKSEKEEVWLELKTQRGPDGPH